MGDDSDGHQLLSVVSAVHHQRVGQALNNRTLGLAESLRGISAGGVGDVHGLSYLDVITVEHVRFGSSFSSLRARATFAPGVAIREGNISDLNVLVTPFVEELDRANL